MEAQGRMYPSVNKAIIDSDNGLFPVSPKAIISINFDLVSLRQFWTNFN